MLVSKSAQHAIRALIYLVVRKDKRYVSVKQIAEETDVFPAFLGKIVQRLTQARILDTKKGPAGGVTLARPPEEITLLEIVEALDGTDLWESCVLGLDSCADDRACPLHDDWARIRDQIRQMLQSRTLADLAEKTRQRALRLKRRMETMA